MYSMVFRLSWSTYGGIACIAQKVGSPGDTNHTKRPALKIATHHQAMSLRKNNGNLWNMTTCNRLVNERNESRRHRKHIDALECCKAATDHSAPMECSHLKNNANRKGKQEERAAEIQLENRILLQKMLDIDTKPSEFSVENFSARSSLPNRTLHGEKHRRELDRITYANQRLLMRLQNAKPSIDVHAWEQEEMDRQALKYRMSQNSARGKSFKLPMPSIRAAAAVQHLPSLGNQSARFREDDWSRMTNSELDQKLLALEGGGGYQCH